LKLSLAEDPSGIQAAIYLGAQKQKLTKPLRKTSQAVKPAPNAKGDVPKSTGASEKKLYKKYKEAHDKGDFQASYNIKKEARQMGLDVSGWM